ncbi:putative transcription factor, K-box [Helianthus annuus]|nr:putative transcription factor, K-box [Helianthus annuus]
MRNELTRMKKETLNLQLSLQRYKGDDLSSAQIEELNQLEQQLEFSVQKVRARKLQLLQQQVDNLQRTVIFVSLHHQKSICINRNLKLIFFCLFTQEKVLEKENEEMYQWLMGKQQEEINQQQVAAMTELKLVGQEQQLFEQFPFFGSEEPPNSVLQLAASLPQLQLQSYPYHLQPMQPNLQESTSAQQNIFGTFKCFNMLIFVDY